MKTYRIHRCLAHQYGSKLSQQVDEYVAAGWVVVNFTASFHNNIAWLYRDEPDGFRADKTEKHDLKDPRVPSAWPKS